MSTSRCTGPVSSRENFYLTNPGKGDDVAETISKSAVTQRAGGIFAERIAGTCPNQRSKGNTCPENDSFAGKVMTDSCINIGIVPLPFKSGTSSLLYCPPSVRAVGATLL